MTSRRLPIVLLDDDAVLRGLLAEGLRDDGFTVAEAATVAEATEAVASFGGAATLVADRSLGTEGPNGFQAAEAILGRFSSVRVIYVTGTQLALRRRVLSDRERSLMKPFAVSQLTTLIRHFDSDRPASARS